MALSDPTAPIGNAQTYFAGMNAYPAENVRDLALVGDGEAMRRLRLQVERLGPHFRTVLLRGETGTGKELVARALHSKSMAEGPFVSYHAVRFMEGNEEEHDSGTIDALIEKAAQGTLFLDGVEEIPPRAQRKLLQILERRPSFRTIASTSHDLRVMAAAGLFRQDIYHRLAMVEIVLEPLRRRAEDIPVLALHFLKQYSSQYRRRIDAIAPEAMERLIDHAWPGNVRELENILHNGVLQCEGATLGLHDLSAFEQEAETVYEGTPLPPSEKRIRLQDVIERHVMRVLEECSGNKVRAAEVLGISRSTLYRMLEASSEQARPAEPARPKP